MISMYYNAVVTLHKYIGEDEYYEPEYTELDLPCRIENHETRVIGMDGVEVICHTKLFTKEQININSDFISDSLGNKLIPVQAIHWISFDSSDDEYYEVLLK